MRAEMKTVSYVATLDRLLDALEQELIDVSDEEILAAARELRLNPGMKGSAIFLGLKYASIRRIGDIFDMSAFEGAAGERRALETWRAPNGKPDKDSEPE